MSAAPGAVRVFDAVDTGVDENSVAVTVGFARNWRDEGSLDAFLVQRAVDLAEDEGVYLEVPIQRYVACGCIIEATLSRHLFEIRIADAAVRNFGGIAGFRASLDLDDAQFESIRKALRFVFRDCVYYKEQAC